MILQKLPIYIISRKIIKIKYSCIILSWNCHWNNENENSNKEMWYNQWIISLQRKIQILLKRRRNKSNPVRMLNYWLEMSGKSKITVKYKRLQISCKENLEQSTCLACWNLPICFLLPFYLQSTSDNFGFNEQLYYIY